MDLQGSADAPTVEGSWLDFAGFAECSGGPMCWQSLAGKSLGPDFGLDLSGETIKWQAD